MAPIDRDRFSWLSSVFLENILKSNADKNAKVIDFELNDAVAKGENYGSQMIRVLVKYSGGNSVKQKSLVIKTSLEMTESIESMGKTISELFGREFAFYRDILPLFKKYQNLIEPNFKCAPICYAVSEDPVYYVFEDLKDDGYRNMDRRIGLNFNATAMLMQKLAKLHAINAMVYEEKPKLFTIHNKRLLDRENTELEQPLSRVMRECQILCCKWPGYEHFAEKFEIFLNNLLLNVERTYDNSSADTFKTLTHGDLWVNNIMYKFDEAKEPSDVIMVDYQLGYYGSPLIDLTYLFYTSTANEVKERDWDRLLQIYHTELVKSLELINYPKRIPTLVDLQIEMLKRSGLAVLMTFTLVPPRHLANSDDADIETLINDSEKSVKIRRALFDDKDVRERIQYLMEYFERKGFL